MDNSSTVPDIITLPSKWIAPVNNGEDSRALWWVNAALCITFLWEFG